MTEIPALRDALVDAAARRARRRRPFGGPARRVRWRRLGGVAAALAVAALAIALVLAHAPREREVPAATPTPAATPSPVPADRVYSVFRRPPAPADALPQRAAVRDLARASPRLVARRNGTRVWLVTGTERGRPLLCTIRLAPNGTGSSGCGPVDSTTARRVDSVWEPPRRGRPGALVLVVPDGDRDLRVTLTDGTVLAPAARDNAVLLSLPRMATSVSWTTPDGARRVYRYQDPDPHETPDAQGCPQLDPLPPDADAQARRAALEAVDRLYAGIEEASVTGVSPVGPGLCTAAVTDRSLEVDLHLVPSDPAARTSASLSQGRLLLGMVNGRMTVWSVQH